MALEHAILVSLAERTASGYDLTRRFDKSIGYFWKASHQQIYKVLGRMEADGLVASEAVPQSGRPDKKVYAITEAGRAAIQDWSRTPSPPETSRSEFAVKLRGLPYGDRDAIVADVQRRAEAHRERLAYYRADESRTFPDVDALDDAQRAQYAVLRGGILLEEAGLAWCQEIVELLGGFDSLRSLNQRDEGSLNQRDEGSLNQRDEGSLNQRDERSLNQRDEGSLNQRASGGTAAP
ncbi:PadR family transcriptional regulator [Mumia xiangluensis]|uniref:PadR family transcriptional regulator n=1 Tax=Mumia xiangluensis TaxID=1678900 RepID=A0ABW1QIG3_9ACTN